MTQKQSIPPHVSNHIWACRYSKTGSFDMHPAIEKKFGGIKSFFKLASMVKRGKRRVNDLSPKKSTKISKGTFLKRR